MAAINFDAASVDITSHDPIPAGTYEAVVTASEIKANKSLTGKGLNLTFEILSDSAKGRKVWAWINFQHQKAEAQRIGQEELARLCKALGIAALNDTEQLHDKPLMITVAIDRNDATRNVIKAYAAKTGAASPQSGAGATAAPASSGTAPWAR